MQDGDKGLFIMVFVDVTHMQGPGRASQDAPSATDALRRFVKGTFRIYAGYELDWHKDRGVFLFPTESQFVGDEPSDNAIAAVIHLFETVAQFNQRLTPPGREVSLRISASDGPLTWSRDRRKLLEDALKWSPKYEAQSGIQGYVALTKSVYDDLHSTTLKHPFKPSLQAPDLLIYPPDENLSDGGSEFGADLYSPPMRITTPLSDAAVAALRAGMAVLLSGVVYTARDAAHKRLCDLIAKGEPLPLDLQGQAIYYVGPTPAPPGHVIGSAGPTTSYRMDPFTPPLLKMGLKATIGKGKRAPEVIEAMRTYKAVYLAPVGGAGALLSKRIKSSEVLAYEDLGPEAIRRLEVEDFPAIVVNDIYGNDFYRQGVTQYLAGKGKVDA